MAERFNCRFLLSCLVFIVSGAVCKVCPSECKDELCLPSGLCEDCRDGFYGIRCNKSCPSTCPDSLCYRFNVSCKKECSEGQYGKKCDKQCSRCPGSCHRWTGECGRNSSEGIHLSREEHQSAVESEASQNSVPDHRLHIGLGVAGAGVLVLVVASLCLIQRRRQPVTKTSVPQGEDLSKKADNPSSEPLLET